MFSNRCRCIMHYSASSPEEIAGKFGWQGSRCGDANLDDDVASARRADRHGPHGVGSGGFVAWPPDNIRLRERHIAASGDDRSQGGWPGLDG